MSDKKFRSVPTLALHVLALTVLTFVALFVAQKVVTPSTAQTQSTDPLALIKTMVIAGRESTTSALSEIKVTRANGLVEPGQADMRLYFGDEVTTGAAAQVTLLFLDAVPEKDNEVFVDGNSRVRIGSIFTWLGRVFIQCRGAFDTKTEKVRLGVQGTQFEVVVQPDGTNRITVLEGVVSVESVNPNSSSSAVQTMPGGFISASYSPETAQRRLEFTAFAGEKVTVTNSFIFTNSCSQRHQYQIQGPSNMGWFRILGADRFELAGGQSRTITFAIELDARNVSIGTYEGDVIARCIDCGQEAGCNLSGLLLPISINVGSRSSGLSESNGPTKVSASRLQEVVVGNNGLSPVATAPQAKLNETIDWSTNVVLASQPSYPAQTVVPNFDDASLRQQQFRAARRDAILRNDPTAYELLGDAYLDWGNGAKALDAYSRVKSADNSVRPEYLTDVAEALRLTGRLDDAEANLKKALEVNPRLGRTLNALGNVNHDRARIARDNRDDASALTYLKEAASNYTAALSAPEPAPAITSGVPGPTSLTKAVPQTNIGEVFLEAGRIASQRGDFGPALQQFSVAENAFANAAKMDGRYAFARKGLGDVYQSAGDVNQATSQQSRADQFFGKARAEYGQALALNRDMAEAHVGLGKVAESTGKLDDAINEYRAAARLRPDQPDPHLQLARTLYLSGQLAAAADYAKTFQRLERAPFQQGVNADVARSVISGTYRAPERFLATPTPGPTYQPSPGPTDQPTPGYTPTPVITPSPTGPLVQVPKMKGDRPQSALNELQKKGLQGELKNQPDCEASGKVVYTNPSSDARVPRGTVITVYVSSLDEGAPSVPPVTGMSVEQAAERLQQAGLGIKSGRKEETDSAPPNTVLRQKPEAGRRLTTNCQVEVTIAIPIPPVRVPNLFGLDSRQVEQTLFLSGLALGEVRQVESERTEGSVIDQYPRPGEVVPRGTRVNLVVSQVTFVTVPNLVGHSLGSASEILGALGLTYKVMEGNQKDDVTAQRPAPGTSVPKGTRIQLWFPKTPPPGTIGTSFKRYWDKIATTIALE